MESLIHGEIYTSVFENVVPSNVPQRKKYFFEHYVSQFISGRSVYKRHIIESKHGWKMIFILNMKAV